MALNSSLHPMNDQPELSHVLYLSDLPDTGTTINLSVPAETRAALAKRFDLLALDHFNASLLVSWRDRKGAVSVTGSLDAEVVQTCVVTLEPVRQTVNETLDLVYSLEQDAGDTTIDPYGAEPLEGDELDVGEIVAEELALALDPYPRSLDLSELSSALRVEEDTPRREGPFDILASLKRQP